MELINTNATAYDSWLSANMSSLRKAIEHLEEPNTNDIIEVTGRMIWQAAQTSVAPEGFEQAYSEIFSPIVKRPYPRLENGDYKYIEIDQGWKLWQAATAQAVPEGFALVPTDRVRYFSHDGENYQIHNTLAEAKHEAECAIEHFSERLADQLCDPRSDGNFHDVGYGIVLGKSGYSVDHIVTQEDVENGEYGYEAGTEIMSLFLIEAQEPAND